MTTIVASVNCCAGGRIGKVMIVLLPSGPKSLEEGHILSVQRLHEAGQKSPDAVKDLLGWDDEVPDMPASGAVLFCPLDIVDDIVLRRCPLA